MREGFDNLQFPSQMRTASPGRDPHQNPVMLPKLDVTRAVGKINPRKVRRGNLLPLEASRKCPGTGLHAGQGPTGGLTFDA